MTRRKSYQEVYMEFESRGCKLLSTVYKNAHQKLDYICSCGNKSTVSLTSFISHDSRCMECKKTRLRELKKKDIKDVKAELMSLNVKLLSESYRNNKTPLLVECVCGSQFYRTLDSLKVSSKCPDCNKLIKENHPNWNPNLREEDRISRRDFHEYDKWRTSVFNRDGYVCIRCKDRGTGLNAHHIKSYSKYPDDRLDTNNGVTLCSSCHTTFHTTYGYKDFTEEDFYTWIGCEHDA